LILILCIYLDFFLTNDFTDYSPTINANNTKIIIGYLRSINDNWRRKTTTNCTDYYLSAN